MFKIKTTLAAVSAVAALSSVGAHAQQTSFANRSSASAEGWYGGLDLGRTRLNLKGSDIDGTLANHGIGASSSNDRSGASLGLNLGYRFNSNFGLEGGYANLGNYSWKSVTATPGVDALTGKYRADAWSLAA